MDSYSNESNFESMAYLESSDEIGRSYQNVRNLETNNADKSQEVQKKIQYSVSLSLSVKNPDSTNKSLEAIADEFDGYAQELGTYYSVIRVKSENLEQALIKVEALGKVQRKSVSGQDVTAQYLDFQIRLENAEKARTRYLELLEKAENVEAALLVEKELERLNGTIDMLKGQMNRMNHLTTYATITVRISERVKPGPLGYVGMGLYHAVKWLFVRN